MVSRITTERRTCFDNEAPPTPLSSPTSSKESIRLQQRSPFRNKTVYFQSNITAVTGGDCILEPPKQIESSDEKEEMIVNNIDDDEIYFKPSFVGRRIARHVSLGGERPCMKKSIAEIDSFIRRPYRRLSLENLNILEESTNTFTTNNNMDNEHGFDFD